MRSRRCGRPYDPLIRPCPQSRRLNGVSPCVWRHSRGWSGHPNSFLRMPSESHPRPIDRLRYSSARKLPWQNYISSGLHVFQLRPGVLNEGASDLLGTPSRFWHALLVLTPRSARERRRLPRCSKNARRLSITQTIRFWQRMRSPETPRKTSCLYKPVRGDPGRMYSTPQKLAS